MNTLHNTPSNLPIVVAALYHFAPFADYETRQPALLALCEEADVKGSLLLASEGINGTIAGSRASIDTVLAHIRAIPALAATEHKESHAETMPFRRMKVRLKKEIVTMGVEGIDPLKTVGTYVKPQDWNALIADPDTLIVDTRNDYEVAIGTFKNAINPETETFRQFPNWVTKSDVFANPEKLEGKKIAMFCTGGIRCEKATAFMREKGFDQVFHLKGGILKYLEEIDEKDSLWEGSCFVFDERVSVTHGLRIGDEILCRACRMPVTPEEQVSSQYEDGVSCPHCYDQRTDKDRDRYRARQQQLLRERKRAASRLEQQ